VYSSHFQQFSLLHVKAMLYVIPCSYSSLLSALSLPDKYIRDDTGSCEKQTQHIFRNRIVLVFNVRNACKQMIFSFTSKTSLNALKVVLFVYLSEVTQIDYLRRD